MTLTTPGLGLTSDEFELLRLQAVSVARSTMMGSNKDPMVAEADAMAKVLVARELGLPVMSAALGMIHMIPTQGGAKLCIGGQAILAMIHRRGNAEVQIEQDPDGDWCRVTMTRRDTGFSHTETWDDARVKAAGLGSVHKTHPMTMKMWRAVSACGRVVAPDDMGGMYAVEEFGHSEETAARAEQYGAAVIEDDADETPAGDEAQALVKARLEELVERGADRNELNRNLCKVLGMERGAKAKLPTVAQVGRVCVRSLMRYLDKVEEALPAADPFVEGEFEAEPAATNFHDAAVAAVCGPGAVEGLGAMGDTVLVPAKSAMDAIREEAALKAEAAEADRRQAAEGTSRRLLVEDDA
jgi:hypothetical protein